MTLSLLPSSVVSGTLSSFCTRLFFLARRFVEHWFFRFLSKCPFAASIVAGRLLVKEFAVTRSCLMMARRAPRRVESAGFPNVAERNLHFSTTESLWIANCANGVYVVSSGTACIGMVHSFASGCFAASHNVFPSREIVMPRRVSVITLSALATLLSPNNEWDRCASSNTCACALNSLLTFTYPDAIDFIRCLFATCISNPPWPVSLLFNLLASDSVRSSASVLPLSRITEIVFLSGEEGKGGEFEFSCDVINLQDKTMGLVIVLLHFNLSK